MTDSSGDELPPGENGDSPTAPNPLDNSLILHHLFNFLSILHLKCCRLVNRTWHREATHHLHNQVTSVLIPLQVPYTPATLQLLQFLDNQEEDYDDSDEWPLPPLQVEVGSPCPVQLDRVFRSLSSHLTQLHLNHEATLLPTPEGSFPRLTHLTCHASNNFLHRTDLILRIVKHSPILKHLHLKLSHDCPLTPGGSWWPLLAQLKSHLLTSLQIHGFFKDVRMSDAILQNLVTFLTAQQNQLQSLTLACRPFTPEGPLSPVSLHFPQLTTLEVDIDEAAYFFGTPERLPRVRNLSLRLGKRPYHWLEQWRGRDPFLSVVTLSVNGSLPPGNLGHQLLEIMASLFPNVRVLQLSAGLSMNETLVRWVVTLDKLEELSLQLRHAQKIWEFRPHPHPVFQKIQVLRLEYWNGGITDENCRRVFLQMPNLRRLHLIPPRNGTVLERQDEISSDTMAQMMSRFEVIWETR